MTQRAAGYGTVSATARGRVHHITAALTADDSTRARSAPGRCTPVLCATIVTFTEGTYVSAPMDDPVCQVLQPQDTNSYIINTADGSSSRRALTRTTRLHLGSF